MNRKFLLLAISSLFFVGLGTSASVGTVPGFIDFGEVEPGSTVEHTVYITTNFDNNFTVNPSARSGSQSMMFMESQDARYETSEEDIKSWVELPQNAEVDPNNRYRVDVGGSPANAYGEFDVTIRVPSDAEPGYHYGRIRLNPEIPAESQRAGTTNWGETVPNFRFRVTGNAEREVQVQDVRGFRLGETQAAIEVLLNNRGTVTTTVENFEINIFDSTRNQEASLRVSGTTLTPGESEWVDANWDSNSALEQDTYQIDGNIDYLTGSSTASGSFSLPGFDVVEVRPDDSPATDSEERGGLPLWLVVMVLVIFAVLMWSFGIDPFWMLLIIGVLGISAFILMSGLSNILLLVLLIVVSIVVYGGL